MVLKTTLFFSNYKKSIKIINRLQDSHWLLRQHSSNLDVEGQASFDNTRTHLASQGHRMDILGREQWKFRKVKKKALTKSSVVIQIYQLVILIQCLP